MNIKSSKFPSFMHVEKFATNFIKALNMLQDNDLDIKC